MKVKKSESMVTPKKIRKMYRQAVRESLDKGLAKESIRKLHNRKVIITLLLVYSITATIAVIYLSLF